MQLFAYVCVCMCKLDPTCICMRFSFKEDSDKSRALFRFCPPNLNFSDLFVFILLYSHTDKTQKLLVFFEPF